MRQVNLLEDGLALAKSGHCCDNQERKNPARTQQVVPPVDVGRRIIARGSCPRGKRILPLRSVRQRSVAYQRQNYMRRVLRVRIDLDRRFPHVGRRHFRVSVLQVAREVGEEAGGDLYSDAVAFQKSVASDQIVQVDFVNFLWCEPLSTLLEVAITCPLDVKTGAHHVKRSTIRCDIQQANPEV